MVRKSLEREDLIVKYGQVYDTKEMMAEFNVKYFLEPYCFVVRKADGVEGSLEFQHAPRYYYKFVPD